MNNSQTTNSAFNNNNEAFSTFEENRDLSMGSVSFDENTPNTNSLTTPVKQRAPYPSGPNHGLWKHGHGKSRPYDTLRYNAWKLAVLQTFNFKCFVTGRGTDLRSHHLNSWDVNPEERYDIYNGVALHKDVHDLFHRRYGFGQNSRLQFEHFCRTEYEINTFPWQQGNHEPSLTVDKALSILHQGRETQKQALTQLTIARGHTWHSGEYTGINGKIVIRCLIHNKFYTTTARNYKRSQTGLTCCGEVLQGRNVLEIPPDILEWDDFGPVPDAYALDLPS